MSQITKISYHKSENTPCQFKSATLLLQPNVKVFFAWGQVRISPMVNTLKKKVGRTQVIQNVFNKPKSFSTALEKLRPVLFVILTITERGKMRERKRRRDGMRWKGLIKPDRAPYPLLRRKTYIPKTGLVSTTWSRGGTKDASQLLLGTLANRFSWSRAAAKNATSLWHSRTTPGARVLRRKSPTMKATEARRNATCARRKQHCRRRLGTALRSLRGHPRGRTSSGQVHPSSCNDCSVCTSDRPPFSSSSQRLAV